MAQGGRFCGRTLSRCVGAKCGTRFPMVNAMHGGRVICDHPDRFCGLSAGRVRRMLSGGTPLPNEGNYSSPIFPFIFVVYGIGLGAVCRICVKKSVGNGAVLNCMGVSAQDGCSVLPTSHCSHGLHIKTCAKHLGREAVATAVGSQPFDLRPLHHVVPRLLHTAAFCVAEDTSAWLAVARDVCKRSDYGTRQVCCARPGLRLGHSDSCRPRV